MTRDEMFVGRTRELTSLERSWRETNDGRFSIVNVVGPAGIGKTALIERFIAECAGTACVVGGVGDELERSVPFGVISQMLRSAPSLSTGARAGFEELVDPVTVAAGMLDLLAQLPADAPLLMVVDDAQWCDASSLEALAFTFRRLRAEPVMALFASRAGPGVTWPSPLERLFAQRRVEVIPLEGLRRDELSALAARRGVEGSRSIVDQVLEHTDGNPLYAGAMFDRIGRSPGIPTTAWTPLPAPEQFAADVRARFGQCTPDARRLAAALSILGTRARIADAIELAEVADGLAAADSLVGVTLVSCELGSLGELAFSHPLIRSAVYHGLEPSEQAALHLRAAKLADNPGSALHHRVAASYGPDPVLVDDLVAHARSETVVGNLASAATLYDAAGRLTTDVRARERFLVEQFDCRWASGDSSGAAAVLDRFAPGCQTPARTYVEGTLALSLASGDGESLLFDVWEDPGTDAWLRGRAAVVLAPHLANRGRAEDALRAAGWWYEAEPADLFPWSLPLTSLQAGLLQLGRTAEAVEVAADVEHRANARIRDLDALIGRGMVREFTDDLAGARADLEFVFQSTRLRSPRFSLLSLIHLAETEYRAGAWDRAIVHGELAASLAGDTEQHWCAAFAHAVAAMPIAGRGLTDAAEEHVARAHRAAVAVADPVNFLWAGMAEARAAHARGEPEAVVRALQSLAGTSPDHVVEPGIQPWRALLAEALVQLGRLDEAEPVLAELEGSARAFGRRSALVAAARVRGQLEHARNRRSAADETFELGEELTTGLPHKFEHGLFDLARGRYLRRTRRRGAAAAALQAARRRFSALGAFPYLGMCNAEMAATGLGESRVVATTGPELTPQELAIAHLVAHGCTNREIAAELFLSVKTVEYHLGKTFTKLGVSTRTQLAQRMTRVDPAFD